MPIAFDRLLTSLVRDIADDVQADAAFMALCDVLQDRSEPEASPVRPLGPFPAWLLQRCRRFYREHPEWFDRFRPPLSRWSDGMELLLGTAHGREGRRDGSPRWFDHEGRSTIGATDAFVSEPYGFDAAMVRGAARLARAIDVPMFLSWRTAHGPGCRRIALLKPPGTGDRGTVPRCALVREDERSGQKNVQVWSASLSD